MHFSEFITIKRRKFKLVKVRQYQDVGIYCYKNSFCRIGNAEEINREIIKHNQISSHNFPMAKILEQGKFKNQAYYIESSLGKKHFGEIFAEEAKHHKKISDKTFDEFLKITIRFAIAQLSSKKTGGNFPAFGKAIHLNVLAKELPAYKNKILGKFAEAKTKLQIYPFVLTHGDFNPYNLYKKGVIDFEHLHYGPAGYDLVTNIFTVSYFPKTGRYEFIAKYNFSKHQIKKYLNALDSLYQSHGLPKISSNYKYFGFCRAILQTVRMQKFPKIQEYRYKKFIKMYLKQNR